MSGKIADEVVNEIRSQNDIVEVISEYVQLTKRGRNHFGLCPFHEEKTPSFSVEQEKQLFHCFGCGKGGNVFTFISEIENIPYPEAIRFLARRVHYDLPEINKAQNNYSKETNDLFLAYDWLVKFYHHLLKYSEQGEEALSYIKKRGLTEETIERFQIGFAPYDSELTVEFLQQKDFSLPFLVKHRLLNVTDQQRYLDPFRGRLIFPIHNHSGKTVAFGGRTFYKEEPKYLNSPEHKLFRKAQILYNYSKARGHIRKQNEVIVFEGYLDVITADQAQVRNVVATLGTSLSEEHAKLLRRTAKTVVLCFDGDQAGLDASYEAATILRRFNNEVKIARLPEGLDPDDYIQQYGGESFRREVIDPSDTFVQFLLNYKKSNYHMAVDSERIAYIEEMAKYLAMIQSPIEREYYMKELANEFNLSEQVIAQAIEQHRSQINHHFKDKPGQIRNTNIQTQSRQTTMLPAHILAEQRLLAYMIKYPHIIDRVQNEIGIHFSLAEHQVIVTHLYALYESSPSIELSELVDKVDDEEIRNRVSALAVLEIDDELNNEEIDDYIRLIKAQFTYEQQLQSLKQKQKLEKNPLLQAEIGMQIIELKNQMKHV